MSEKEIDLGEGCKIRFSSNLDGSKSFCLDCNGEEQFEFKYHKKGNQITGKIKSMENFKLITDNVDKEIENLFESEEE